MRQLRIDDPMSGGGPAQDEASQSAIRQLLADPALGRVWLIRVNAAAVAIGYAVLTFGYSIEFGGRYGLLDELFIEPDWRGRRIGRAAMRMIESESIALGLRALLLEVSDQNLAAARLYNSAGFAPRKYRLLSKRLPLK